ncbi:hypothetical protein GH714_000492 [Hevea brasiliensis]|uniref:Transcriptional corepressor SEUSS n=1 Tax=Hevea brasiliensis TaxID=3981 RepID=A0A6A6L5B5_HEVBR|nr:hypothetical protein GH714_000492 [Hevea brasiliensis]
MLGAQGGPLPSQTAFPSLVSPRTQFNNMNMLGNVPNMSFLNQSFGNGGPNPGLSGPGSSQRGAIDGGAEIDPLSGVGSGMGFNAPSSSFVPSSMVSPGPSGQVQGQQFSNPSGNQLLLDQQQPNNLKLKVSSTVSNLCNSSLPRIIPSKIGTSTNSVYEKFSNSKIGTQHSDQSLFLHQQQQQQQQQFLPMSRQTSQAAAAATINLLHQQRLLQMQQQHHQQQLLKAMPQQRPQLAQQFQQQNLPLRSPVKAGYEPGMCARRLTHYMYQQQHRPEDNNIEFWRKFVAEFFAPHAKKKWCVSMYGSGRQTTGVFPQDIWHCEICNRKPGRGFGKCFEQLRVVRDGQLRIVFSPDLKICSWEFCARRHEELIPRRLLIPQVSQLGAAAQKYQAACQNASSNLSVPDLQNNCNMFVASARQLAKALEVPLVNDLGYTKRYVRCLQISEVVNSMKDLIDYSRETGTGPMESLAKFPRRTSVSSGFHSQAQQPEEQLQQQQQQTMPQNSNSDQSSVQAVGMQIAASNGVSTVNNSSVRPYGGNSVQIPSPGSSSTVPQAQSNPSAFQSPTPSSSNNPTQASHSALTAPNHIGPTNSPANIPLQQPALSGEADHGDAQSSVQKIIHEIMMSSQMNGTGGMVGVGSLGNDMKNVNGILPTNNNAVLNGGNGLVGNGTVNNSGMGVVDLAPWAVDLGSLPWLMELELQWAVTL